MENWNKIQKEFYAKMRSRLSKDPFSRVTEETRNLIDNNDCIFDIHCHIFDRKTVNIKYILLRMAVGAILRPLGLENNDKDLEYWNEDIFNIYNEFSNEDSKQDWDKFETELEKLEEKIFEERINESFRGKGLKDAIKVLRKSDMKEIFDFYIDNFSLNNINQYRNNPFVTAILMMDLETGWEVKTRKRYVEQVEEINTLANERSILPFFAIDPRRADFNDENNLYNLFERAFAKKDSRFFGVKCYPSLGYFPSDKRLEPIFALCEEFNIPITTHCGGESVSTHKKSIEFFGNDKLEVIKLEGKDRASRARYLNDPKHWLPVFEKYPKLKLNLAHFGTDYFWENHQNTNKDQRILDLINLLNDQDNRVYTDFSYNLIEYNILEKLKEVLRENPNIQKRIMYGTDFWVVLPSSDLLNDIQLFLAKFKDNSEDMVKKNIRDFLFV